ncbi:MAG: TfoX/Sxy family protein [Methanobacteriaceae archaeon]|jgi:DNA transformation protein|nr:TfoX/Sxy family protein [Candidatus Methanorudis spinitermitis]
MGKINIIDSTYFTTKEIYQCLYLIGDNKLAELTSLKNIGKKMEKKLISIDISTVEELKKVGSKETFFRLKLRYPNVCLVHLYTLEGAISGIEYNLLSPNVKHSLKGYIDSLK